MRLHHHIRRLARRRCLRLHPLRPGGATAPATEASASARGAKAPGPTVDAAEDYQDEDEKDGEEPLGIWDIPGDGEKRVTAGGKVVIVTGTKKMADNITFPAFPHSGQTTNWLGAVATGLQAASGYWDGMDIQWIYDCRTKTLEELSTDVLGAKDQ